MTTPTGTAAGAHTRISLVDRAREIAPIVAKYAADNDTNRVVAAEAVQATARSANALGGPAPYWTSWTYKPGGLRGTQIEHKAASDTTTVYGYPSVDVNGGGQPHSLTSVAVNGGAAKTLEYDEQGNTTKRCGPTGIAQSLTWDIEGELGQLTEGAKTTDYLYDANGDLLIRRGADKSVLYLAGQELHYDTAAKKFTAQRYYPAGDITAVRTETSLTWMVDDHHGTASMAVDAVTQSVTRRYTKPFGESRGASPRCGMTPVGLVMRRSRVCAPKAWPIGQVWFMTM